jgi:hypothetical protein
MGACAWEERHPTPELTPAAIAAWDLYRLTQSQWNVGMNGATGMRYEGVEACARMAGLEISVRAFQLFQLLEGKRLGIWHEERVARDEAAKRKTR